MNDSTTKLALAALAAAALSGCASTRTADLAGADVNAPKAAEQQQVSRPAAYGSRGGYRYRRLVAVNIVPG